MRSIYCPNCDKRVETNVTVANEELMVKKVSVNADQEHAICPSCGSAIADEEMCEFNSRKAFEAYRAKKGLLTPRQIKESYSKYGLTQGSFAKLLGLGAATLSRYENGALQSAQVDGAIRRASDPHGMLMLLDEAGSGVIPADQEQAARRIALGYLAQNDPVVTKQAAEERNASVIFTENAPSELNGYRRFNFHKLAQMVVYITNNCEKVGRTKLNKALFYTDYACFAATSQSMSGLVYARAPYGPIVNDYGAVFSELVRQGIVIEREDSNSPYDALIYVPLIDFDSSLFSSREFDILKRMTNFINGFSTVHELSEYSHKELLWKDHLDGDILSYMDAYKLNDINKFI